MNTAPMIKTPQGHATDSLCDGIQHRMAGISRGANWGIHRDTDGPGHLSSRGRTESTITCHKPTRPKGQPHETCCHRPADVAAAPMRELTP